MSQLKTFQIAEDDGDYVIHFTLDDGSTVEIMATFDQLDLISEEIDRQLNSHEEEALEPGGDSDD